MNAAHPGVVERIRNLRTSFAEAHRDGMASLRRGDVAGFGDAIRREREIIAEQQHLIDAQNMRFEE